MLGLAVDLSENGIERVLECAVDRVPLRRPQLVEVAADTVPHLRPGLAVAAVNVSDDVLAREHRLREVVEHLVGRHYITRFTNTAPGPGALAGPKSGATQSLFGPHDHR